MLLETAVPAGDLADAATAGRTCRARLLACHSMISEDGAL